MTNADAAAWYKGIIKANMLGPGLQQSGWMCDFGEYIPYDAVLASGVPASVVHNQFRALVAFPSCGTPRRAALLPCIGVRVHICVSGGGRGVGATLMPPTTHCVRIVPQLVVAR